MIQFVGAAVEGETKGHLNGHVNSEDGDRWRVEEGRIRERERLNSLAVQV